MNEMSYVLKDNILNITMLFLENIPMKGCVESNKDKT